MRALDAIVLVVGVLIAGAAAAQPKVRLVAPTTLVADGETKATLKLQGTSAAAWTLDVDAGAIGERRVVDDGIEFDYLPPRVALPRDAHVTISGPSHVAATVISLTPAPRTDLLRHSGGALSLSGPAALVLGQDETVTLTLQAQSVPALTVNVGALEPPVADGPGRWRVRYTPPRQHSPQLALFVGRADGMIDSLILPLYGVGRIESRTKPRARITLRLGGASFGPFRTDGSGVATTPVFAPPGVHSGTTQAIDTLGNAKETPFDLGTPPFSRLVSLCAADVAHIFVSDEHGAPSDAPESLLIGADTGGLDAPRRIAPGHYTARWRPGGDEASAEVSVEISHEPVSRSHCQVQAIESDPKAILLSVDRASYQAGSGALTVTAQLRYPTARGGRARPITLDSNDGTLQRTDDGRMRGGARYLWRPSDRFDGKRFATVRATTTAPALSAELAVPLVSGPPMHIDVQDKPSWLVADGSSRARLVVHAQDAFGNPTAAAWVVTSARGVSSAKSDGVIDYTPNPASRAADDQLVVRDPASGFSESILLGLHAAPAAATLAVRLGYLTNFGKTSAAVVFADASFYPRRLRRRLALGLSAGFYQAARKQSATQGNPTVDLSVTGIPILATVGGTIPLGRIRFFAGVGGGILVARIATSSSDGTSTGIAALGAFVGHVGSAVDVGFGHLVVDAGYIYAPRSSGGITGNFGGLAVTAGYQVGL